MTSATVAMLAFPETYRRDAVMDLRERSCDPIRAPDGELGAVPYPDPE